MIYLILSICPVNNQIINYVFPVMYHFCIGIKLFENILCNFLLLLFLEFL